MGKKDTKRDSRQPQKGEVRTSQSEEKVSSELHIENDRSARHLREIDRREGEMNHGETGGNFRHLDEPDRA